MERKLLRKDITNSLKILVIKYHEEVQRIEDLIMVAKVITNPTKQKYMRLS